MWKSIVASLAMIVMFFVGWPVPKVAIVTGAALLITRRVDPEKVYRSIDWGLLVMFAGLFIVIAGIEKTSFENDLAALAGQLHLDNVFLLSGFSAVLSNLVSNVPAVLVFKPLVGHLTNPTRAWLTLAMSSTLAGNLTLLGSVANLIVVQQARAKVRIGFWQYFRVGAPLAVLTILFGAAKDRLVRGLEHFIFQMIYPGFGDWNSIFHWIPSRRPHRRTVDACAAGPSGNRPAICGQHNCQTQRDLPGLGRLGTAVESGVVPRSRAIHARHCPRANDRRPGPEAQRDRRRSPAAQ